MCSSEIFSLDNIILLLEYKEIESTAGTLRLIINISVWESLADVINT